ncbi:MAG: hypothetical protein AAF206_06305 [Bacteroidota bacterium]
MLLRNLLIALFFLSIYSPSPLKGQKLSTPFQLEEIINQRILAFDFTDDNRFRVAAYAEMKGRYSEQFHSLSLHFGSLGSLTFYENNCLLRTDRGVFHLDMKHRNKAQIQVFNQELDQTFNKIILLGTEGASPDMVSFVDETLARKNIEPFDKLFLRHILLKYGRYEPQYERVTFHTKWLPDTTYSYRGPKDTKTVVKPANPLMVKLDKNLVRGYYIQAGGTVYVEDVDRKIAYATGEEYKYNVAAFKLFIQKLFVQTTHYVVAREQERLASLREANPVIDKVIEKGDHQQDYAYVAPPPSIRPSLGQTRGAAPRSQGVRKTKPLYHQYQWIPMMLNLLRSRGIHVTDPDIIPYLLNHKEFERIYQQLTPSEKELVDIIRERNQ